MQQHPRARSSTGLGTCDRIRQAVYCRDLGFGSPGNAEANHVALNLEVAPFQLGITHWTACYNSAVGEPRGVGLPLCHAQKGGGT